VHVIRLLNHHGDEALATWAPDDPASVRTAEDKFNALVGGGYLMFAAEVGTIPEGPVRTFDPKAREYLAHRPFVGG
jgi:hypothetical protein